MKAIVIIAVIEFLRIVLVYSFSGALTDYIVSTNLQRAEEGGELIGARVYYGGECTQTLAPGVEIYEFYPLTTADDPIQYSRTVTPDYDFVEPAFKQIFVASYCVTWIIGVIFWGIKRLWKKYRRGCKIE